MKIALITAAGVGSRMGEVIPKQFISVYDKPVIIYTLEKFQNNKNIDVICVVCLEGWIDLLKTFSKDYGISKLKHIVKGGNSLQESISNGLYFLYNIYNSNNDIVLIHDGSRPNTTKDVIDNAIDVCMKYGDAIPAIKCVTASFYDKNNDGHYKYIEREKMIDTQTPHAFYLKEIVQSYNEANKLGLNNIPSSCVLYDRLGKSFHISKGDVTNIKLTTLDDVELFKALLKLKKEKDY